MTEREWWAATAVDPPIDWLFYERRASTRSFRLFWAAACRQLVPLTPDYPELVELLDLIEKSPDSEGSDSRRAELKMAAYNRVSDRHGPYESTNTEWNAYLAIVLADDRDDGWLTPRTRDPSREQGISWRDPGPTPRTVTRYCSLAAPVRSAARHVALLHDIFGPLPFRDIALNPAWLTTDVQLLTRGIYAEKAFDRMPILADALQDAGCDNEDILNHCREQGWEHVRGCWVIDLLLGRPWRES